MAMQLDPAVCTELAGLVEKLAHSGRPTLDQDVMKKIKKICKLSDDYVKQTFHMTMTQLEKDHAEIRLSAFQMINELFVRSHCFRQLLVSDFQNFLELTAETNLEEPLPLPNEAAKLLKSQTLEAVQKWHTQFGEGYKKLQLGYDFLKTCKKVNFEEMNIRTIAQQQEEERKQAVRESQRIARLDKVLSELSEMSEEIEGCLRELDNCLCLLLPTPEDFQVPLSPVHPSTVATDEAQQTNLHSSPCDDSPASSSSSSSSTMTTAPASPSFNSVHSDNTCVKREKNIELSSMSEPKHLTQIPQNTKTRTKVSSKEDICASVRSTTSDSVTCDSVILPVIKQEKLDPPFIESSTSKIFSSSSSSRNIPSSDYNSVCTDKESQIKMKTETCEDISTAHTQMHIKKEKLDMGYGDEKLVNEVTMTTSSDGQRSDVTIVTSSQEVDNDVEFHEISSEEDDGDEEEELDQSQASFVQQHGLGSRNYNMEIVLTPGEVHLQQNPDNTDLVQAMLDMNRLMTSKYLPAVQKHLQSLTKNGADQKDIKKAIDLKQELEAAVEQCQKIHIDGLIQRKRTRSKEDDDSDSDSFEDVAEKEGYEPDIPEHLKLEYRLAKKREGYPVTQLGLHQLSSKPEQERDPTSLQASLKAWKEKKQREKLSGNDGDSLSNPSSSNGYPSSSLNQHRNILLQKAPKVPFGVDLFHWNKKDIETPTLLRYDSLHRFWTNGANDEVVDKAAIEAMHKRVIHFTGEFQPVKWKCRVPLPNGKLCERMDRKKCPFHGNIIARNAAGQPANPNDQSDQNKEGSSSSAMDWEDPELQHEIEMATGATLTKKKKVPTATLR